MSIGIVDTKYQGKIFFPNILQPISASYVRSQGVQPGICTIEMAPQNLVEFPIPFQGNLTFQFRRSNLNILTDYDIVEEIVLKECRPDRASFEAGVNNRRWIIPILDRRWKWQFGSFSGHWNVHNGGRLVPRKEKTPYELVEMCLLAMGEEDYEIKSLEVFNTKRADVRPEVHWDRIPPAKALEEVVTSIGYRICLGWDDVIRILPFGEGEDLPSEFDENGLETGELPDGATMLAGIEFDFPERPDSITLTGGHTYHEAIWELEPVGLDVDDEYRPMDHLSYVPVIEEANGSLTRTWSRSEPPNFEEIQQRYDEVKENKLVKDEIIARRKEQLRLARETAWKCYRLKYPIGTEERKSDREKYNAAGIKLGKRIDDGDRRGDNKTVDKVFDQYEEAQRTLFFKAKPILPGPERINSKTKKKGPYELEEFEQILPCYETRAEMGIDPNTGNLVRLPVKIFGIRWSEDRGKNTRGWEEIPRDEYEIIPDLGIIRFKDPVYMIENVKETIREGVSAYRERKRAAKIVAMIAVPLKELNGEPARYEYVAELPDKYKVGTPTKVVVKNDIVLSYKAQYSFKTTRIGENQIRVDGIYRTGDILDNIKSEKLEERAENEIALQQMHYYLEDSGSATYAGLVKRNLDGALVQMALRIVQNGGITTVISRNHETNILEPNFNERQREEALKDLLKKHREPLDKTEKTNPKGG